MKLTVLGCYAATPRAFTNPTSQVLEIKGQLFLIDCGEGTQVQLRRFKVKFSRIERIFISHLHGDHFYGLVGLISTFRLLGRDRELHIYGPKGIKEAITMQLKLGDSWTNYPLYFHELESKKPQVIFENSKVVVETIPLEHRVYTNGYLFREKPGDRKLIVEEAVKHGVDKSYFNKAKKGFDVPGEGDELVANHLITEDPDPPRSYAFCSDTIYLPRLTEQLKGVDFLYHESTFLSEHDHLATKTKHSTAAQAAQIAKDASVGKLILGHYSTRYPDIQAFADDAERIFQPVELAEDGKVFDFDK
ncbi:ribonuclease Z [Aureitalea marina]|uniref:Ribonuclease Z n=1 Tax=Aureitalea marina TaxID=930804 RepID=A0A2S7KNV9_9FLAO|nr:ribonuclease Z [Aureitalea marina]PQB04305.1 ribonuclease Z [Aureitalea marina]